MEPLTLEFLAQSCGGKLLRPRPGAIVRRVCSDSRALGEGDLFVALRGENFDGHLFVEEAYRKGAAAVLIEQTGVEPSGPSIVVKNARSALGKISANYRRGLGARVIAVAGSNGKTSAKELIRAVLSQRFKTHASEASFNNDIGVPLTLLGMDKSHEAAVVEIGTNHPGELAPLAEMAQPQWGVITSIGREHLEFFQNLRGVAEEEGALGAALPKNGKLFLNGDSPELAGIIERSSAPVVLCGKGPGNAWRHSEARTSTEGTRFKVHAPHAAHSGEYALKMVGEHQAGNALFAIAIGAEMGMSREEIAAGLLKCHGAKMRMQIVRTPEFVILNDAYNANADSVGAALETLARLEGGGRRVAILGDMAELGAAAEAAHEEIGKRAANAGVSLLIAVGRWSGVVVEAAREQGMREAKAFSGAEEAMPVLRQLLRQGDTILVKASRSARLERLVAALEAK